MLQALLLLGGMVVLPFTIHYKKEERRPPTDDVHKP